MLKSRDKTAIVAAGESFSFDQLLQKISATAAYFGIKKQEKVVLFGDNSVEWIVSFYATWRNEGIAVPVDTFSTPEEVAYILDDCSPELVFVGAGKEDILERAFEIAKHKPRIVTMAEVAALKPANEVIPLSQAADQQTAVIIYTSGTTGSPKGVMLSYLNLIVNADSVKKADIIVEKHNIMILLPLHHIFPLLGSLIAPLRDGCTAYICPSLKSEDILKTFAECQPGFFIGVPRLYDSLAAGVKRKIDASFVGRTVYKLAKLIDNQAFSRKVFKEVHQKFGGKLLHLVVGGAALPIPTGEIFKVLGFNVLEGFGMTEAAPMITYPRPNNWRLGTTGEVLDGCEVAIKDGEVIARGPNIMQGYYNRPEETAAVIRDGWLYTGDLGEINDGFLSITGRIKEIIVTPNGKNINPAEIEYKLITAHPIISDAGVFLHEDAMHVIVFPEMTEVRDRAIDNLDESVKVAVAEYNKSASPSKRLMKIHLVSEELPRTRLGKLQRFRFVDLISTPQKAVEKMDEPQDETYQQLKRFVERETGKSAAPNSHFEIDLGMDSLTRISMLSYIESAFGVIVVETELSDYTTLSLLSEFVNSKKGEASALDASISWAEILKQNTTSPLPTSGGLHACVNQLAKLFFKLYFKFSKKGTELIPEGPSIFAANHQSSFDSLFVQLLLNKEKFKTTYVLAKEKHFAKKWMRAIAVKNNIIIMDINSDLKVSIQKMAQILRQGNSVMIFPEGTRSLDGELITFRDVFAILSCELQVPVVPVVIDGSYLALPSGKKSPKYNTKISAELLNPIYPEAGETYGALRNRVKAVISEKLKSKRSEQ